MSIKSKIAALLLAGGITITSIFGLSGCKGKQVEQPENEKEKIEEVIESQQQQIDKLKEQIEDLQNKGKETINLEQELEQLAIQQELLNSILNSYRNAKAVKIDVETNNQTATIYSTKNKSVATGKDGADSLFCIYDGEEANGVKLTGEGTCVPTEYDITNYTTILSDIKYDILEDSADASYTYETIDNYCIITRTLYSDDNKTDQSAVEKYYFNRENEGNLTRIEICAGEDELVYVFESVNEEEFNQKYSEVENKIEELNNQTNPDLNA